MGKYRKKPVVIETMRWPGDGKEEEQIAFENWYNRTLETLEGTMTAQSGDWTVRGVKGEFYPVKPDIFEATYGKVEQEPPMLNEQKKCEALAKWVGSDSGLFNPYDDAEDWLLVMRHVAEQEQGFWSRWCFVLSKISGFAHCCREIKPPTPDWFITLSWILDNRMTQLTCDAAGLAAGLWADEKESSGK